MRRIRFYPYWVFVNYYADFSTVLAVPQHLDGSWNLFDAIEDVFSSLMSYPDMRVQHLLDLRL